MRAVCVACISQLRLRPGRFTLLLLAVVRAVGPFMFGTSISVVDVIHAPLFVRLEAAQLTRGLDIPDTLVVRVLAVDLDRIFAYFS